MKRILTVAFMLSWVPVGFAQSDETQQLKLRIEEQGRQIEQLQQQLARIERVLSGNSAPAPAAVRFLPISTGVLAQPAQPIQAATATTATTTQTQPQVAGFRFGADFRYRFDGTVREASPQATGVQNMRQRYRLRFNIDRDIATDLSLHVQLATGAVNNGITFDQDFAGGVLRHPFFVSEAYADYHPNSNFSLRGGKQEEVFADNTRFMWDDDVRFNGFHQRLKVGKVEFKAGQYLFINPNVFNIPSGSPLTLAGATPGTIGRASQMFHQGFVIESPSTAQRRHQLVADVQIYRNPSFIALTSNATGVPAVLSPAIGLTPSGPAPGTGNATTSATNATLAARHYQIAHAGYRFDSNSIAGNARYPLTLHVQASRNVGTSQLRDAVMGTVIVGRTQNAGEVRGLYTYAIKDANSMISQLTDDDLGTGVTTNLATHHFRFDYTLRRGVVFQNLVFRQTQRRDSNPAANFFVPLGRSLPASWRYQGQLAISF